MHDLVFALWLSMQDQGPPDADEDDDDDEGGGLPVPVPSLPSRWPPRMRLSLPRTLPPLVPVPVGVRRSDPFGVRKAGAGTTFGQRRGPNAKRQTPNAAI